MKDVWKEITKENLEQDFANGLWHKEIAEKYEVSSRAVYDKVKKLKVDIERKNKSQLKDKIVICPVCGREYKSLIGEICGPCKSKQSHALDQLSTNTESEFGQKIIELRKQGFSYDEIAKKVGCCKSTVSYHCKTTTRIKAKQRHKKQSHKKKSGINWRTLFSRRFNAFYNRKPRNSKKKTELKWKVEGKWWNKFQSTIKKFKLSTTNGTEMAFYKSEDALKHLNGPNTKCYLTGIDIDMTKDDYQLDHKIPVSRGGSNSLDNLGITCPEVNQMKGPLTNEELFYWCQKILEHNGYTVIKNENIETQSE